MSLSTFHYSALDSTGHKRKGTIRGVSEQDAFRKVTAAGLTPLVLEEVRERAPLFAFQRVSLMDVVGLTRELAVLVEARIPLDRGLVSIAEHEPKQQLASMVRDIAGQIEAGHPMTTALEKYRAIFGDVYISSLRAAEKSGNLRAVMHHLAELLERRLETRKQVRRAMTYPVIVLTVVAVAVTIIVGFVVPKFAATFQSQGATLPAATRIVQALGMSLQNYWYIHAGVVLTVVGTLTFMWRSTSGRVNLELALLRIPYLSRIITSVTTARFARVLGISLSSGLDVTESIELAGQSTGRPVFTRECTDMASRLRQGDRLADVLQATRYLPPFARRMLGAGKDSSEVSGACEIVSRHYDRESSDLTRNINTIIEPMMTVALAGIVLLVALSVFLPMWQMARLHH
ncbi:MAG: type II secretion system F family protein [Phycisphaerales bacterium]